MRKKVMVVDDKRDVIEIFKMLTERYELIKAKSGRDAIEKLHTIRPDLMLLGISMSDRDGWKVLSMMKARLEYRDIPLIMMTDKPDFSIIENGIENYIIKPVIKKELINAIEGLLRSKLKERELREAITASDASGEQLTAYETKVKKLMSKQRLLSQVRQIMIKRKMEDEEVQLNLMKSFERAIDLEWAIVHRLQNENGLQIK